MTLSEHLGRMPLIAILRGLPPEHAAPVAGVLIEAGFRVVEVPLNGARALDSLRALAGTVGEQALIGAGTVLEAGQVRSARAAGARLIVMPHGDGAVVAAARAEGLFVIPGVQTPSEAFAAWARGPDALKLFPAEALSPAALKALRAVLPAEAPLIPVGGITPDKLAEYWSAGAAGFGIGGALYRPDKEVAAVAADARRFVAAARALRR